jgi:two-component system chemotaxis response regulator CheB
MNPRELIRVLVIDDSAFSRQTITQMLKTSPLVEVIGVARDGEDALRKTLEMEPDLVTLDLEMPRMDGFTYLRLVMAKRPTPVMVISGRAGEQDVFKALDLGAVDFIAKPTPRATPELVEIEQELIRKVHSIRELRIDGDGNVGHDVAQQPFAEPQIGRAHV